MNRIKEYREKLDLTQTELAEISGVARTIINQLETGVRQNTTMKTMCKLSSALQQPVTSIFFE